MARPGEPKTSERRLAAAERNRKALDLRRAGVDFETIEEKLGYRSKSGAYDAVMAGLKATLQEPADELRKQELSRLDRAQMAIWEQVRNGNHGAIDRLLRIMDRRAKLLGLDAPVKVAPTTPDGDQQYTGLSDAELAREIVAVLNAARARADGGADRGEEAPG